MQAECIRRDLFVGYKEVPLGLFLELMAISHNFIIALQVFGEFIILVLCSYFERVFEYLYKYAITKNHQNPKKKKKVSFFCVLRYVKSYSCKWAGFSSNLLESLYWIHGNNDKVIFF